MSSNREEKRINLILHIGAGKTGSSSIQLSLLKSIPLLNSKGFDYWGLMLENAPAKLFPWQRSSETETFLALPDDELKEQLLQVFEPSINDISAKGIHTIIWSNEGFFGRHKKVFPALKALSEIGVNVQIIAYVRAHEKWMKSAYIQWGIKHKTYKGPIIPFSEYIQKRPVGFFSSLKLWRDEFGANLIIKNFEAADDVVTNFAQVLKLPSGIHSYRTNESPSPEELFLRALFNNGIAQQALPVQFENAVKIKQIDFTINPVDWMRRLLPTSDDLANVLAVSQDDRNSLNEFLIAHGEDAIKENSINENLYNVDNDRLIAALAQIIVNLAKRVAVLERINREEINRDN